MNFKKNVLNLTCSSKDLRVQTNSPALGEKVLRVISSGSQINSLSNYIWYLPDQNLNWTVKDG